MVFNEKKIIETFNFDIVEKEVIKIKKNPKIVINADTSKPVPKKSQKKIREVFGVKRKTMTSEKGTVIAKIGNTLTKKEDDKKLKDDESDSLPSPAEEFLITSMPRAINEVRPEYPDWAKQQKISGSVIFEILIDKNGTVRQAILLRGLNPKLDQLAKEAILKFKFKPAFIEKKPAAVRIKYAIKYLLES
jgi:protein TonB